MNSTCPSPLPAQTHSEYPAIASMQTLPRLFQRAAQLMPHNSPLHKSQHHLSCTKRQEIVASKGNSMGSVQRQYPAWCIPTAPQNGPRFAAESPAHIPAPLTTCLRNPLLNSAPGCSRHSPSSRNCCSSCHFGFIKTLEPDKQIFVGFFLFWVRVFCL